MKPGACFCCTVILVVLVGLAAFAGERAPHAAIVINNDYEFTVANGVCSGSGTLDDPYVIGDWIIDAGYDDYGIRIHGTTRAFRIENVEISGAAKSAIYLSYVSNAEIVDSLFIGNWTGITFNFATFNQIKACTFRSNTDGLHFYFSDENQVLDCAFEANDTAIWFDASDLNLVRGNQVRQAHMAVYMNFGSQQNSIIGNAFVSNIHHAHTDDPNTWDLEGTGNYWDGYKAIDADEDGIWDKPFEISADADKDHFPLVLNPFVAPPPPDACDV